MAAVPPTDLSSFSPSGPPLIQKVIDSVCPQLPSVKEIHFEAIDDEDQNHRISLTLMTGEKEAASIFSIKDKGEQVLIQELKQKIEAHLINRERTDLVKFESGAMLKNNSDVKIEADGGRLLIDDKVAVLERDGAYLPIPTPRINTYTSLQATVEAGILKISDEYDQERTDGKEGFLFALDQVHEDPELGPSLILYRSHAEIPA